MSGIRWIGLVALVVLASACAVSEGESLTDSPLQRAAEPAQEAATPASAVTLTPTLTPTSSPILTPAPVLLPVQTTEVPLNAAGTKRALRAQAEAYAAVWGGQDWERLYQLVVTDLPQFQEACSFPEFSAQMTFAWESIRAFSYAEAGTKIELRVIDVQVDGEKGKVYTDWFFDGLPSNEHLAQRFEGSEVTGEPNKHEWLFVEGKWREQTTKANWDPSVGCPKPSVQQ